MSTNLLHPHNILQEFVNNEVIVSLLLEMFLSGIVRKLHVQHTDSYKISLKIASTTDDLDISWNLYICSCFNVDN